MQKDSPDSLKKIDAIIRKEKFPDIDQALKEVGISGLTFFDVEGRGRARGMEMVEGRGARTYRPEYVERAKLEIVVKSSDVRRVVEAILEHGRTGAVGDGKILVYPIEEAYDITSGESGDKAV